MKEIVDTGKIIHQEKIKLENKELKLIYNDIFSKLEPRIIKKGLLKIL